MAGQNHLLRTFGLLLAVGLLSSCMQVRTSDSKTLEELGPVAKQTTIYNTTFEDQEFRYVGVGSDTSLPLTIFVHGAPGSSDAFLDYLKDSTLLLKTRLVSIDRLGYGYSGFGKSEISIDRQARAVVSVIDSLSPHRKVLLVGHSYGGPIIANCAMNFTTKVKGIVMLAPALDPENEKIFWFSHLGRIPPFRWVTPKSLKVATDEKFSHADELDKMMDDWGNIVAPVTHMHGDGDKIVPYENMAFSQKMLISAPVNMITLPGENHFIPWTQEKRIKDEIMKHLKDF